MADRDGEGGTYPMRSNSIPVSRLDMAHALRGIALALCCAAAWLGDAQAADRPVVLFLSSFHKDIPAQRQLEAGLNRALGGAAAMNDMHMEFLDSQRLPAQDVTEAMTVLIERKYRSVRFETVVAWGQPAAQFAAAIRATLGHPRLIFVEITAAAAAALSDPAGGDVAIVAAPAYGEALAEALRLSEAERLVVIGDAATATGSVRLQNIRDAIAALGRGVAVDYILDQPLDEVAERVAHLPPRTAIFYILTFSDGRGAQLTPFAAARRLAATANAPIFSAWESLMGSGIAGGHLLSIEAVGQEVGNTILALRQGQTAREQGSVMRVVYDWPQMERWGWNERMLPAGAITLNRPPSVLELYRWQILMVAAFIAVLGTLAVFLARAVHTRNSALIALSKERTMLAERVRERTAELARSNAELEQFAYAASHDLRQPLRAVSSYLTLIKRKLGPNLDGDLSDFLAFAVDGAKRMDAMIIGLLDYSRVGRGEEAPEAVDLGVAVADALANLAVAVRDAKGVVTAADGLPTVLGHRLELVRLFQNLIDNALKYVPPERTPIISIGWSDDGDACLVWVADNGTGISAADRERAFGVFQRLVGQSTCEGTGIGLALCRKIVEHHRGRIWIEDNPTGGCVFMMRIPKG